MKHPLQQKIVALRRDARQRAVLFGICILSLALLGTIVVWGTLDYLFRFQDRGLRVIASLLALGVCGGTLYRYVLALLWTPLGEADLARRVQRQFPSLGDRLLSAVEFLHAADDDPAAGSAALRRAVVDRSAAEAASLEFAAVLDWRPVLRAGAVTLAAYLAALLVVAVEPSSLVSVVRLAHPLGDAVWPRANHLMVRRPVERVARGRAFQIEVIDARDARLPPEVRIHYRFAGPDAAAVEETEPMRYVDGAMVARRENVLWPFSYRVEGGDDQSMPWRDVQVAEPPAVESVSVRLIPPAYTGWPPVPAKRHIRALVGSVAQISGRATKPLRSATLCVEDGTGARAELGSDGYTFAVGLTVEKSGSYWFDLTDREGLGGGDDDRWEIHAVADSPPTVDIERPSANLFVVPQATVPLRVAAHDDLAVRSIALVFRRGEEGLPSANGRGAGGEGETEGQLALWEGGPHPSATSDRFLPLPKAPPLQWGGVSPSQELSESRTSLQGDRRVVEYRWNLAPLNLRPGTQVTFYATAADYRPQTGQSGPRSLTVVTIEEMQDRIAGREKLIVSELTRVLGIERGCRAQVEALRDRLARPPRIGQAEIDQIQAVAHNQREAEQALSSRGEGVAMHIRALLADLENNRLATDAVRRRMSTLLAEIDRLGRAHLPAIGRELTAAAKTAQVELEESNRHTAPADPALAASLAAAAKHQDAVIAALAELIGRLARDDSYRRFAREIGRLLRDQQEVARRTVEAGRRTLGQELRELAPQAMAELQALAGRQLELARWLDRLLQEMDQAGGQLRQSDPAAAETVAQALDQARRLAVSGRMRGVGQQIQQNQTGRATADQQQVGRDLQAVLDVLTARQTADTTAATPGPSESVPSSTASGADRAKPGSAGGDVPGEQSAAAAGPDGRRQARPLDKDHLRAAIKRLWGELPAHARPHVMQSAVEEFPPKYEVLIEAYFRRLAEETE